MTKKSGRDGSRSSGRTYYVASAEDDPAFFASELPSVEALVASAIEPDVRALETCVAITVRPSESEVALLDEIAKLFSESRNATARNLLAAAMNAVLQRLPAGKRREIEAAAAKAAGWKVVVGQAGALSAGFAIGAEIAARGSNDKKR